MIGVFVLAALAVGARHEFVYLADGPLRSVSVAGTFNVWNKDANPLSVGPDGRTWRAVVEMPAGRHAYRFVLDGARWIADPRAKTSEDDGHGNLNSVVIVLPPEYATPARRGDGRITATAVRHQRRSPEINYERGRLSLSLVVRPGDIERASVWVDGRRHALALQSQDEVAARYGASLAWNRRRSLRYAFELIDGPSAWRLGPKGLVPSTSKDAFVLDPRTFRPIVVPGWVERTVFYQIFPDRFYNGERTNDHPAVARWTDPPDWYNRFGGDAAGISRRIGYLRDLGIDGVYINPVMKAVSNHRYDPTDYYRVDPEIGTNAEFAGLTKALRRAGIRLVLDQAFDHVGTQFPPFLDLLKNQQASRYKDWFFVKRWPVKVERNPPYAAWFNAESVPKINQAHPGAQAYLLESVDFWHREADLSGWRLDVGDEVPDWFWRKFRAKVKRIDPDVWILGETWGDASHWLQGDLWDASMNYPWRDAVRRFVARGDIAASRFVQSLMSVYGLYAPQVSRNQFNMLSSHDTPRFLTEAGGDRALQKMAAVVQFAWPGAPSVYYGEELGMEGRGDPDNRRAMRWDLAGPENDMLRFYRRLIAVRQGSAVLQQGDPVSLPCFDAQRVACFGRKLGKESAWVALNRSEKAQTVRLRVGRRTAAFVDMLTGRRYAADRDGVVRVMLPGKSAVLALEANAANLRLVSRVQQNRNDRFSPPTTKTTITPRRTHG